MISFVVSAVLSSVAAADIVISVDANRPGHEVSRSLYGIFFEEINQAGEGGLYPELLRNRGFEDTNGGQLPVGWKVLNEGGSGSVSLDASTTLNPSRFRSLRIERTSDSGSFGVVNEGFWGIPVTKGKACKLVLWLKGDTDLNVGLQSNQALANAALRGSSEWKRHEITLRPTSSSSIAKLVLIPAKRGTVWVSYSSLMPTGTWGKAKLRKDLGEKLAAMKPGFLRFPGGCFVEGETLQIAWDWKGTLGPIEERKGMARSQWGYPICNGLGFHEYLQLCEDLGAEAMYVANVGMSHREVAPMENMDRYLQDALDAIEYANGPVSSKWGAVRAKNGHPKPFNLKYVEIGNENGGAAYNERFALFSKAIGERYPDIVRIANLWGGLPTSAPYELIDEHYYNSPAWFWRNANRYDSYVRRGPKIYVGEYAVTNGSGRGNLAGALGEAAFMTGMERNADIVRLASYAPLLENVNNRQWNPNAILFDSRRSYGTPSYWVQVLFAQNRPERLVDHSISMPPVHPDPVGGKVGLQTWRTEAEFKDIEVTVDGKRVGSPTMAFERPTGNWTLGDGVIRQSSLDQDRRVTLAGMETSGAKKVVMTLKARKIRGDEGFIIMFEVRPGRSLQWNLGGWNNTVHAFQMDGGRFGKGVPGRIESDRWYEIRIEQEANVVRGYLDGKLLEEAMLEAVPDFAAVAGIVKGEMVLKVVNGAGVARTARLDLNGVSTKVLAKVITLSGKALDEENTFDAPSRIAPRTSTTGLGPSSSYTFPPYSLTILRVPRR